MDINPNTIPNRIGEAKNYLNIKKDDKDQNNYVYINYDKVMVLFDKTQAMMKQIKEEMQQSLYDITGKWLDFNPGSRNDMITLLTNYLGIPNRELLLRGKLSISKDVIQNIDNKYKTPFTSAFLRYVEYQTLSKGLKWYKENLVPVTGLTNNEGDRISKVRTFYTLTETFRLSTNNPNLQGLNLHTADIITAPKDWVIVQIDSGQIEPRIYYSTVVKDKMINWLIKEYDDVYYALADYCLRESTDYRNDNLFLHPGISKGHRQTLKTLVNAGTYGSSLANLKSLSSSMYESDFYKTEEGKEIYKEVSKIGFYERNMQNDNIPEKYRNEYKDKLEKAKAMSKEVRKNGWELAERFFSRIVQHPQRMKFEKEIQQKIYSGSRKVYSPFGDERTVYGDMNYIKNCFINNPMQMAVSRLSALSVCSAFEFIESNDKLRNYIRYAFLKHDEDVYYVRKEIASEVVEILKSFREYNVDGWIPIKSGCTISLDYIKD